MKHKLSTTLILLTMFLVTQLIGLFVVSQIGIDLPYGLETPSQNAGPNLISLIFSFIFAFALILVLMKYKWKIIIKIWFFFVVSLALSISIFAIMKFLIPNPSFSLEIVAFAIALPLALSKLIKPNAIIHNSTELLIYPGIATVFIPMLTPLTIMIVLILISIYDMWAVWKSGVMQKMAKFQMEEIKIFGGFLIPTMSEKTKDKIKNVKQKYKGKKIPKTIQEKKYKVNLAILGGGDVVFPIITSGIFLYNFGIMAAISVTIGALAGLSFLFWKTKKGKAYPAMPYITVGIFLGISTWKLINLI